MRIDTRRGRKRHGISAIVAAVIMFAMLFTVGTDYFLFVNNAQQVDNQALSGRNTAQQSRLSESLSLSTLQLSDGDIGVYGNNTGGIGVNITAVYLQYQGKRIAICEGVGLPNGCSQPSSTTFPSCQLPAYVNTGGETRGIPIKLLTGGCTTTPGTTSGCTSTGGSLSSCIDTGQPANATTATIRAVTQRGNVFSQTYPPSATSLAAQALSSGAIGDLYLSFRSFSYYTLTQAGCPSSGTPEGTGTSSGYCLSSPLSGFDISSALTGTCSQAGLSFCFAWSVRVTNYNPQHANIVLDPYTLFSQIPESGKGSLSYTNWYVVSNYTAGGTGIILTLYSGIVLSWNHAVSIVFASGVPLTTGNSFVSAALQGPGAQKSGSLSPAFIISHACEAVGQSTCVVTSANYGQNSPYVATLYY